MNQSTVKKPLFSRFDLAFSEFLHSQQPSGDPNHKTLAALVSHLYMQGHTCLDLDLLASRRWDALGLEQEAGQSISKDVHASVNTLPWINGESSPLVLHKRLLFLRKNWEAEQRIIHSIRARLEVPVEEFAELGEDLDQLFASNVGVSNPNEPDWQKLACAVATRKLFTLITGGPGTGKTTTVAKLLALLVSNARKSPSPRTLRIALAAPTGKAAARLGSSIRDALQGLPKSFRFEISVKPLTLHKLLDLRSDEQSAQIKPLTFDVIVIDEASMISLSLMDRLLASAGLNTRLIFLGDQDQLASVEAGAVMGQLCLNADKGNYTTNTLQWFKTFTPVDLSAWGGAGSALAQQTVMLRRSHRVAGGSVISQWASHINAGKAQDLEELKTRWRELKNWDALSEEPIDRLRITKASDPLTKDFLRLGWSNYLALIKKSNLVQSQEEAEQNNLAKKILEAFSEFQVLTSMRDGAWGVNTLNTVIAQHLGFKDEGWYAGRPVMITRNNYHLDLRNGDIGICLEKNGVLRVAFASDSWVEGTNAVRWVLPSRLDAVESVFAMTVHKSQGSEFNHVCLVIPEERSAVLTRELIYTGLTRAKKRVTWVAPKEAEIFKAVQTQLSRSGGLHALHESKSS